MALMKSHEFLDMASTKSMMERRARRVISEIGVIEPAPTDSCSPNCAVIISARPPRSARRIGIHGSSRGFRTRSIPAALLWISARKLHENRDDAAALIDRRLRHLGPRRGRRMFITAWSATFRCPQGSSPSCRMLHGRALTDMCPCRRSSTWLPVRTYTEPHRAGTS